MASILKMEVTLMILLFTNIFLIKTLVVFGWENDDSFYNYELLLSDYNLREVNETSKVTEGSVSCDHPKTFPKQIKYNINDDKCTDEDMNHINVKSVVCLIKNIARPNHPSNIIFKRLWRVFEIWLFIYLITALPLWCTRGWCCCCFCRTKPSETILEAKKYLALNPPGILIDERGRVIYYEPTVYEKECYERFEHLIRTI